MKRKKFRLKRVRRCPLKVLGSPDRHAGWLKSHCSDKSYPLSFVPFFVSSFSDCIRRALFPLTVWMVLCCPVAVLACVAAMVPFNAFSSREPTLHRFAHIMYFTDGDFYSVLTLSSTHFYRVFFTWLNRTVRRRSILPPRKASRKSCRRSPVILAWMSILRTPCV